MHHNQTIMVQVVPTLNPQALLLSWLHLPAGEHDHRGQRLEYRSDRRLSLVNLRKGRFQIQIRRIQMFWASWIRIRIHHYLYGSGFGSFHQQAKKVTKTLISTFLWVRFDFFSLKKADVNVLSKSIEPKNFLNKNFFCWNLVSHWQKNKIRIRIRIWNVSQWYESADPDPYQNVTESQHYCKL
jgi:hypothetical protein